MPLIEREGDIARHLEPSYRTRLSPSDLSRRAEALHALLSPCRVCPRQCGAERTRGRYGVCRITDEVWISSAGPHYGEEPPLVGFRGSGTIFFTSCNLKCQYCQNHDISQLRMGHRVSIERLAGIMLSLQSLGCHNINLVTPTHVVPQITAALASAVDGGLRIPLVYNCGGYESVETLQLLDGIIDIYMPDMKYASDECARRYSGVRNYWPVVRGAVREMQRQVGDLRVDERGIATRGLLIRHLVLPEDTAGTSEVVRFIAEEVSRDAYVNIMDQYRPVYHASRLRGLNRPITVQEYERACRAAALAGLHRGFPSPS